ncbi:isochorismatase family cysteine hydrolase [Streptomyces atratus]|uniref:isochorismatase family cysteine hydrolase n=1 Tax=Streptomyces atratus TaxID=1893 RepID=UPI002253EF53|nr:isochorismatase family cysteine hydrolase [Streptomyces atratus]MCX5345937.1 cysteine hydrolase [Streptomyces atratus]
MPDTEPPTHAWHIDDREYRRQEERRGRRYAYTSLDPARTALAVIDMVPFFVDASPYARGIVPNIERLANHLRNAGGTVAWVLPARTDRTPTGDEFHGPETAEMFRDSGGTGPLPDRLWHDFTLGTDDLLVEKSAPSAFFPGRCPLPELLQERGINTVLITGTVTNVCCESSARDAWTLGYRVIMVADANATGRDRDHNATLHTIYRSFGDVRPTTDVLALIRPGARCAAASPRCGSAWSTPTPSTGSGGPSSGTPADARPTPRPTSQSPRWSPTVPHDARPAAGRTLNSSSPATPSADSPTSRTTRPTRRDPNFTQGR